MQSNSDTLLSKTYHNLAYKCRYTLHAVVLLTIAIALVFCSVPSVVCLGQTTDPDGTGDETVANLLDQLYSTDESVRQTAIVRLSEAVTGSDLAMQAVVRLARSSKETETVRLGAIQAIADAIVAEEGDTLNVCREFIDILEDEKTPAATSSGAIVIVCYGTRKHGDTECSRAVRETALRKNCATQTRVAAILYLHLTQMTVADRIDVLRRCVERSYDSPDIAVAAIEQLKNTACLTKRALQADVRSLLLHIVIDRQWGVSVRLKAIETLETVVMYANIGDSSLNKEEQVALRKLDKKEQVALRGLMVSGDENRAIKRAAKEVLSK